MNSKTITDLCVCHSGKSFKQCCDRFLHQNQHAKTPVQLMRSRYSAFALGDCGEYLLTTWNFEQSSNMTVAELSMKSMDWVDLEIVSKSQKGDQGFVEFKAYYLDEEGAKKTHHEKSNFERLKGRWFYVSGEVI
jgi:SEC-C motif-containing protein